MTGSVLLFSNILQFSLVPGAVKTNAIVAARGTRGRIHAVAVQWSRDVADALEIQVTKAMNGPWPMNPKKTIGLAAI